MELSKNVVPPAARFSPDTTGGVWADHTAPIITLRRIEKTRASAFAHYSSLLRETAVYTLWIGGVITQPRAAIAVALSAHFAVSTTSLARCLPSPCAPLLLRGTNTRSRCPSQHERGHSRCFLSRYQQCLLKTLRITTYEDDTPFSLLRHTNTREYKQRERNSHPLHPLHPPPRT